MRLNAPTRICKLCFKDIKGINLFNLVHPETCICRTCFKDIVGKFISFRVSGYKALAVYHYDEKIQSLIYQLKGCFDIEIADVFLSRYKDELNLMFHNYVMIPVPSYFKDDLKREFNHVVEIFKTLKLPMLKILRKTKGVKQANSTSKQRKDISKYLTIKNIDLSGKKVLIVDDVYTTGSTMKAAIKLVEKLHPKTIKVLVISKTIIK
jgi:competence protein ComFC